MIKIELNTPLTTLNDYINAERRNKYNASKIKRDNTNRVHNIAKVKRFKLPHGLYDVHIDWYKPNNKMDHDNISFCKKFVFDGLVKAGSIQNDNPKVINNFSDSFHICEKRQYIWCEVTFKESTKNDNI